MNVNIVINVVGVVIQVVLLAFAIYATYKYSQSKERAKWWESAEEVTSRIRIANGLRSAISKAVGKRGNASISVDVDEVEAAIAAAYTIGRAEQKIWNA